MYLVSSKPLPSFKRDLHIKYIKNLNSSVAKETYEYWLLEHLRLNGLYWGIMALATMDSLETLSKQEVVQFVMECFDTKTGGFAPFPGHDAHVLSTLSGLQILLIYDQLEVLSESQKKLIVDFIISLRMSDGSFQGDRFGEIDTRFVFVSLYVLTILGSMTEEIATTSRQFILACENFDGGFGMFPLAESHAAQVYTCVAAIALCDSLSCISDRTASWLSERQVLPYGGFNGRPEKLPDSCYSWWVLLSLVILQRAHWISAEKLEMFILECQDSDEGGCADRPDNQADVYHTCFSLCGLALIAPKKYALNEVDPVLCLPKSVAAKIKYFKFPKSQ